MTELEKQNLPNELVEKFIFNFYGYGNLKSDYWYIGLEEGGGNSFQEINQRMQTWQLMGASETIDNKNYHLTIGIDKFFREKPKPVLQSTWSKLIRVHLRLNDAMNSTEDIRSYQNKSWGREHGDNCLLELMPLPSPDANQWNFNRFSLLPYLVSRNKYWNHILPQRVCKLRNLIKTYNPKLVLFYGLNSKYIEAWTEIAGSELAKSQIDRLTICGIGRTLYAVCPHPVAHGLTNNYFDSIGDYLREILLSK